MLEQILVRHCAPTLADIKTGNLFHYPIRESRRFEEEFGGVGRALNPSGVCIRILKRSQEMFIKNGTSLRRLIAAGGQAPKKEASLC